MPNGRLLNRDDLDEAFPDNPVRIDHVSMHGAVLNSLALAKYGISAETKTPPVVLSCVSPVRRNHGG